MHNWGDKEVDWEGISDAAYFIGEFLRRWGRISVGDTKEKYGTVRVYLTFGWYDLHSLVYPGYHHIQWKKQSLLWKLNYNRVLRYLISLIGQASVPYQEYLYFRAYKKAIEKWPHLREEILNDADYPELLRSL